MRLSFTHDSDFFTADDPFDDFFGSGRSRQRGASRGRMGGSLFGFGSFPAFGPGFSGFDSGGHIPTMNFDIESSLFYKELNGLCDYRIVVERLLFNLQPVGMFSSHNKGVKKTQHSSASPQPGSETTGLTL